MNTIPEILGNPLLINLFCVFGLGLVWLVLKFVFKLATRIFFLGCFVIAVVGGLLFLASTLFTQ